MRNKIIVGTILAFFVFFSSLFASDWTEEQKEVWKNVEEYWRTPDEGLNVEELLTYYHEDFLGWDNDDGVPTTKADREKSHRFENQTTKVLFRQLKPVGIKVHGNVAIVHYYYMLVNKDSSGNQTTVKGRWTDTLIKQGDKWVMIADHGGIVE
jgi:ketosteroid isomerase-like protein